MWWVIPVIVGAILVAASSDKSSSGSGSSDDRQQARVRAREKRRQEARERARAKRYDLVRSFIGTHDLSVDFTALVEDDPDADEIVSRLRKAIQKNVDSVSNSMEAKCRKTLVNSWKNALVITRPSRKTGRRP